MSQSQALIGALKLQLKAHGKTYLDVAQHLNLSHASVKRLFSEQTISLNRLEAICDMIEISLTDLILLMNIASNKLDKLTL
ncbi:MAG: helix-turn-helix transcriptional regulator, partial [Psychromonas sp.]